MDSVEPELEEFHAECDNCEPRALQHFDAFLSYSADDSDVVWKMARQMEKHLKHNQISCLTQVNSSNSENVQQHDAISIKTIEYLRKLLCNENGGEASLDWACETDDFLVGEIEITLQPSSHHPPNGKLKQLQTNAHIRDM